MLWITYSPIISYAQNYYGIEEKDVIEFSDSYMYIYFALSFLVKFIFNPAKLAEGILVIL